MGVELKTATINRIQRMLRRMDQAANGNNPYARDIMASPPTVALTATTDASLGAAVSLVASNAFTSAGLNNVAYYGGVPKAVGNQVYMPVSTVAPALTGNNGATANTTADMMTWCYAEEIETDAPVVEFGIFANASMRVMLQVDGQYVDKTGWVGAQAGGANNFLKLTFATRKVRRIRLMHGLRPGNASGSYLYQIRLSPTCNFWKPSQASVLTLDWIGDSYGEGQNTSFQLPNGPMAQVAGELLGFRNVRQRSVGGTGYVSVGGTKSKMIDQLPYWLPPGSPLFGSAGDLIVIAHGYNDRGYSAQVRANALAAYRRIREYSSAPIIVLGAQPGKTGPDALASTVEAAIAGAVSDFGDPYCAFAPVSTDPAPWTFGTGYVGATNNSGNSDIYIDTDGVHPTDAGHAHLGSRAAGAIYTALKTLG